MCREGNKEIRVNGKQEILKGGIKASRIYCLAEKGNVVEQCQGNHRGLKISEVGLNIGFAPYGAAYL